MCTVGYPCEVACVGKASCMSATIVGTGATDVSMSCSGEDSCKPVGFTCGTGKCSAQCASGLNVCVDMTVNTNGAASFECIGFCPLNIMALIYTLPPSRSPTSDPSISPTKTPTKLTKI